MPYPLPTAHASLRRWIIGGTLVATLSLLPACARSAGYADPATTGTLPAVLRETSGLAPSRLSPDLLWALNDSGGAPTLYALSSTGALRGSLRLTGAYNHDWEDLASFLFEGRAWLLIADTGDNNSIRGDCSLLVLAEPSASSLSPQRELTAPIAWRIPVLYPGGPRDCEAVAVDAREGLVYLLTKRLHPAELYTLPLRPPATGPMPAARLVGNLRALPRPSFWQRLSPTPGGRYRDQPTALAFAADGHAAAVLTYGTVFFYPRASGEAWATALAAAPLMLPEHKVYQAEALTWDRDHRTLWVAGESRPAPLRRYQPLGIAPTPTP